MAAPAQDHLTRQTVVLVPNTHCPSCAAAIEGLLSLLHPPPLSVATSIVSHTVTVDHDQSLKPRIIAEALHNAGYDVKSIIAQPTEDGRSISSWHGKSNVSPWSTLKRSLGLGSSKGKTLDVETKENRHRENCVQCREEEHTSEKFLMQNTNSVPFVAIDQLSPQAQTHFMATLSIGGMSCASCIGQVSGALENTSRVTSVSVALVTNSASVEFEGEESDVAHLVEVIEDLGYEATIEHVEIIPSKSEASPQPAQDLWTAYYSVEGMTCSSCVAIITEIVNALDYVQSVEVNLITHSATVIFEGKDLLALVTESIEDAGYGATVDEFAPALAKPATHGVRRQVSIRIDGMHCHRCPGRVVDAFTQFEGRVIVEKPATMQDPIINISYTPNAPDFTIRTILGAISVTDSQFTPRIHYPPTIEERASQVHARAQRRILYRVLLTIIVAIPTFVIGIVYMSLLSTDSPGRQYFMEPLHGISRAEWALFILATPVYFFAADVFHRRTVKELYFMWKPSSTVPMLRRFYRFGSMDMLISLGTSIAYFSSVAQLVIAATSQHRTVINGNTTYFDSVVFLTMFLLIGRLTEAYSKAKTGDAVLTLQNLRPKEALLLLSDNGKQAEDSIKTVNANVIDVSDRVRVVHGASPPWDGTLLSDSAVFDESSLTGESKPVKKAAGDPVYSGTINKGGPISIEITRVSGESMLDQIIKVVREGQARRAPIERVADTLTSYFVPVITVIAITTWIIWLSLGVSGILPQDYLDVDVGGWPFWSLQFAIAVFIIACPCGIGLATPTALFVGAGLAAKHGILAKGGGEAFQEASRVDVVVFDKTGTLTQGGDPEVTDHEFLLPKEFGLANAQVLAAVKDVEGNSSHPIGRAIINFCGSTSEALTAQTIEEVSGKGMHATFSSPERPLNFELLIGNESLVADHAIFLDAHTTTTLTTWKQQAKSIVIVALKSTSASTLDSWAPALLLSISDALRPESASIITSLTRQNISVWMLSGDNLTTARAVGAQIGIPETNIIASVLPHGKAEKITYLQQSQVPHRSTSRFNFSRTKPRPRAIVAMVGDGVNDAPALTAADIGIAIGSGSDVALSSADFVLVNSNLASLLTLLNLSRVVFRRVKFNFAWALVYNVVALPIAAGVLYPVRSNGGHVRLDPVWASLAMALSSVSVVCSSLLMRSRIPGVGFRASTERDKMQESGRE
nr:hypothetical protein B0A51_01125 [Rachicladosporium sp. CCFEE 5018]